jgi:hypothetical protein
MESAQAKDGTEMQNRMMNCRALSIFEFWCANGAYYRRTAALIPFCCGNAAVSALTDTDAISADDHIVIALR